MKSTRILLVDDDALLIDAFSALLAALGHDLRKALSGASALHVLARFRPQVAFIDIDMPGMSGMELVRRLRKDDTLSDTTLVACTGHIDEETKNEAIRAGFDVCLSKPVGLRRIQAVLAGLSG
ncbi:response regulator [Paraburkholderia phosphatilytica]|uniref:response regulator n=1 Tax=Paraburkholderia phosphatilytica TaxID=2282883 RepID=UPI000E4BF0DB|nr:response regulator [Paraburkholderia phosphatilytica]